MALVAVEVEGAAVVEVAFAFDLGLAIDCTSPYHCRIAHFVVLELSAVAIAVFDSTFATDLPFVAD